MRSMGINKNIDNKLPSYLQQNINKIIKKIFFNTKEFFKIESFNKR